MMAGGFYMAAEHEQVLDLSRGRCSLYSFHGVDVHHQMPRRNAIITVSCSHFSHLSFSTGHRPLSGASQTLHGHRGYDSP